MKKILKVAVIGCGNRGTTFSQLMSERKEEFQLVAACDIQKEQLKKMQQLFGLKDNQVFKNENEFFKEKRGDILVIGTYDTAHVPQAIRAMNLGYDLLLEKPLTDSEDELRFLLQTQQRTGRKVVVCHELRYGPGFVKLKELLNEGAIGTLLAIDAMERVAYWHFAQAYVRIQSNFNDVTHPTILAKCSHDLDLVQSYAGAKCKTVSSIGALSFFRKENAPEGATKYCLDCPHVESCPYSAKKIYIDMWHDRGCPEFIWPFNKVTLVKPTTEENLYKGIKNSYFGKCVFHCNNESNPKVSDHQMVQMQFENGVIATQRMVFAQTPGRRITLFGTYGELVFDERLDTIEVRKYGEDVKIINTATLVESGMNHGGGDNKLVSELYDIIVNGKENRTSLTESAESHYIGIAAEKSRRFDGKLVEIER